MRALTYAWSCYGCPESGTGVDSDKQAEKHTRATGHATTTHLERKDD